MPVYAMNIFKLSKETCTNINRVLAKFWWSKGEDRQGLHWFAWDRMGTSKKDGEMGFRDIGNFNLALLGKQAWRILQQPQCLMAKILKGRYFSDTNILNAIVKRKASYVWRSILQGCALLKKGMRFVIGDVTMINLQSDPWLPVHPPRPPNTTAAASGTNKVSDLIHNTGNGWNEGKIRELISVEDVSKVLAIKLCKSAREDFLGWHYTKDGIYTVKSAYWLATQMNSAQPTNPPPGNRQLKSAVWKLNTAPKIKHFFWKLLSGALATGETLRRRHISSASSCHRCCQAEETTKHLFFDCLYAQSIWRASGFPHQCITDPHDSLDAKLDVLLNGPMINNNPQAHQLGLWILWRIWKSRNVLVFQRKNLLWHSSLALARNDAREWLVANEYLQQLHEPAMALLPTRNSSARSYWKKPATGWIKCNYDGPFINETSPTKAGWIFRDEFGIFQGAGQASGLNTSSALECEWQALLMAMQHAWTKGYRKVLFEGDNKQVSELIKHQSRHFASYNWLRDVNHWILKFAEIDFIWTPRTNNVPADQLARSFGPEPFRYCNHTSIPLFISNSLQFDFVNSH